MREGATSPARETPDRESLVRTHPNVEIVQNGERKQEETRGVATQRFVWENRQFVFRSAVAGLLLSTGLAFLIPNRFQSTAHLMPPDQGNSGLAMLAAASGSLGGTLGSSSSGLGAMAGDLLGLKNSSDLFIGVLQSRTVQEEIINKFNLKSVYWDRRIEDAREDLGKHTDLFADRKTGIITILVTDTRPERAAAIAGEYINELDRVVTQLNTSSAHRERVFLEDRLTQVKQDLESAEQRFSEFASKNTALDIPTQGKAMIEAAATMEGQLIAAQTELESLKQIYADGNVRVRSTQARVNELRRQLQKNLGGKSGDGDSPNRQEGTSLYPTIRELPALGVGYADLYRSSKIQEAIFQTLTQEYELAKVQEAKETPSVKVLDSPDIPGKKSFPPRLLIMTLGTLLAMAMSVVWVLGKKQWDEIDSGNAQKALANEVISTVRARIPWAAKNGYGPNAADPRVSTPADEDADRKGIDS
jgi:capsule polysaccharide export protein KpsE/RkpR